MIEHLISEISEQIQAAHEHEQAHGLMREHLRGQVNNLHRAIDIPAASPIDSLMAFIDSYIDSVPEHLMAFNKLSKEADIDDFIQPFINLACAYFLKPPSIITPETHVPSTLEKTYLTQRLLEEVNDQVLALSGAALAPLDMSMANIISYAIIGDEQANALDHLVLLSLETETKDQSVFEKRSVRKYMQKRKLDGWSDVHEKWPCFTKDIAVLVQIG